MKTRKNHFKQLDRIVLAMMVLNALYLMFSFVAPDLAFFHRTTYFKLVVVWDMLLISYVWNIAPLLKHLFVKWALFPFMLTSLAFFTLLLLPYGTNIFMKESNLIFIIFYLLFIPLHLMSKASIPNRAMANRLTRIAIKSFVISVITCEGFLYFSHSPGKFSLNFHELLMNFMWISTAFLILFTFVLGSLQLMHLIGQKQGSTHE